MTVSPQNELSYVGVQAQNPPNLLTLDVAPTSGVGGFGNQNIPVGTLAVVPSTGASYQLVAATGTKLNGTYNPTWATLGGGSSDVNTINTLPPTGGNITIAATANQVSVANAGSTVTLSLPAAIIAPGSITATTSVASTTTMTAGTGLTATTGNIVATSGAVNAGTTMTAGTGITATTGNIVATAGAVNAGTSMTATLGAITATNGNLVLGTAGNKLSIATGANASVGTATLTNGTVTVNTTAVTASSVILLTRQTVGTTGANDLGILSIGTVVAATSFVINAWTVTDATTLQADDQSVIGWMIIN